MIRSCVEVKFNYKLIGAVETPKENNERKEMKAIKNKDEQVQTHKQIPKTWKEYYIQRFQMILQEKTINRKKRNGRWVEEEVEEVIQKVKGKWKRQHSARNNWMGMKEGEGADMDYMQRSMGRTTYTEWIIR